MTHSLEQILNQNQYSKTSNSFEVDESNPNTKVKKVKFVADKFDFFAFDRMFIENANALLKCDSCKKLVSICDGVFLIETEDCYHLFLVELKSSFSTQEYCKAKQQIEASFSKVNTILSHFEKYDEKVCKIYSFIIGLKLSSRNQDYLLKIYQDTKKDIDNLFCVKLIWENKFNIKKENSIFKDTPLKFKDFDVIYFPYEEIAATGIDITPYLNS